MALTWLISQFVPSSSAGPFLLLTFPDFFSFLTLPQLVVSFSSVSGRVASVFTQLCILLDPWISLLIPLFSLQALHWDGILKYYLHWLLPVCPFIGRKHIHIHKIINIFHKPNLLWRTLALTHVDAHLE